MLCTKCHQPMVDPDNGERRFQRTYAGRYCPDCIGETGNKLIENLDTWEYMQRRGIRYRLRDAALIMKGWNV